MAQFKIGDLIVPKKSVTHRCGKIIDKSFNAYRVIVKQPSGEVYLTWSKGNVKKCSRRKRRR